MGYVRASSVPSLIAGGIAGVLLVLCAWVSGFGRPCLWAVDCHFGRVAGAVLTETDPGMVPVGRVNRLTCRTGHVGWRHPAHRPVRISSGNQGGSPEQTLELPDTSRHEAELHPETMKMAGLQLYSRSGKPLIFRAA